MTCPTARTEEMTQHASRRQFFYVALAASTSQDRSLLVRFEADALRVSAPQIRFLNGKLLEQLRNGVNVGFLTQVTMFDSPTIPIARSVDRFVVSFDLWEEKFSATRLGPPARSAARLTAAACETWCLDQLLAPPPGFDPARIFYVKLELRAEDPRETAGVVGDPGISLTRLIEAFGRPPRAQQLRWTAQAGPLRLADLRAK